MQQTGLLDSINAIRAVAVEYSLPICMMSTCLKNQGSNRRNLRGFAPGAIFAFVRWAANDFGTLVSRLDILRACCDGEPRSTIPGVKPGVEMLLRLSGWDKVERALKAIDGVTALGVAPEDVCPDHSLGARATGGAKLAAEKPPEAMFPTL